MDLHNAHLEEDLLKSYEYQDLVIQTLSQAESYQADEVQRAQTINSPSGIPPTTAVGLPRMQLPRFNGDYLQWRPFWSQFRASVHDQNLPDATKFTYLRGQLSGIAADAIACLAVTGDNYDQAVKDLQS